MNPLLNTPEEIRLNCIKFSVPTNPCLCGYIRIGIDVIVSRHRLLGISNSYTIIKIMNIVLEV